MNQTIKAGYALQVRDRIFDARPFSVFLENDNPQLRALDESEVFAAENFGPGKFSFNQLSNKRYRYIANNILNAGYLQLDNQLNDIFRLVWGLRLEHFDQLIGSVKVSDFRHSHSEVLDLLPGLNLTAKLNNKTNLRFSASQTVVRPELREIASFTYFDFELNAAVVGNPDLKRTKVSNADLRFELYPRAGELVTAGVFYKHFRNAIEAYFNQSGPSTSTFNFLNARDAYSYGAEVEVRKKLDAVDALKNFTVAGNLSYIFNEVNDRAAQIKRPMQGQSPYIVNASLQYDLEKAGINTTLLFNQIGKRIIYVGNDQVPAIWEHPRPLLDFQIAKKIMEKRAEIKLNVSDIFRQRAYFYHDLDKSESFKKDKDAIAISRTFGTTFGLTFAYNFK
jgi:outer membrane receptor protein involved in Fe transport